MTEDQTEDQAFRSLEAMKHHDIIVGADDTDTALTQPSYTNSVSRETVDVCIICSTWIAYKSSMQHPQSML